MAENNFQNTQSEIQTPIEETCDQVELKNKAVPAAPRNSYAGYSSNELSNDEESKLKRIQSFDERKNAKDCKCRTCIICIMGTTHPSS